MLMFRSTFFKKRRAERISSTMKCLIPQIISLLYVGRTFSMVVSPSVTGSRYNAASIIIMLIVCNLRAKIVIIIETRNNQKARFINQISQTL